MDDRTRDIIAYTFFWFGMAMAATGIIGEVLGWWNELGLVLTVGGFLVGVITLFDVNGRRLLQGFEAMHGDVRSLHEGVQGLHDGIRGLHQKQDRANDRLDQIVTILDERLPTP